MAKLVCPKCGEISIPINVPKNIENSETGFARFGKKLLDGVTCQECGMKIKLIGGKLQSKSIIKEAEKLKSLMNNYSNSVNPDDLIHKSNEVAINRILEEMKAVGSLFYNKNILFYVLVGENSPDGCITYNTRTFYSGVYTMFPEIKKTLLEHSLDAIKTQHQKDKKLPDNKIIDFLKLNEDNEKLKKKIKIIENEYQRKLKEVETKINSQYSEISQKQKELNHFKELYGKLKENKK